MNRLLKFSPLLLTLSLPLPAAASGVYQCTGPDGEVTFTFTPCAPAVAETAPEKQPASPPRQQRLANLDADIAQLEAELRHARQAYQRSLDTLGDDKRSYNQLTTEFEDTTSHLAREIARLQTERRSVLHN